MGSGNINTVLDVTDLEPGAEARAYALLRRLANRHGCHSDHCKWPEPRCGRCKKAHPERHNADVKYLHKWLQMLGLEPYDRKPRTGFIPSGQAVVNYQRPGGADR